MYIYELGLKRSSLGFSFFLLERKSYYMNLFDRTLSQLIQLTTEIDYNAREYTK